MYYNTILLNDMLRLNFILNVYKEIFEKNDTAIAARSLIQRDIP